MSGSVSILSNVGPAGYCGTFSVLMFAVAVVGSLWYSWGLVNVVVNGGAWWWLLGGERGRRDAIGETVTGGRLNGLVSTSRTGMDATLDSRLRTVVSIQNAELTVKVIKLKMYPFLNIFLFNE